MWRTLLTVLLVLAAPAVASASSLVQVDAPQSALERLGLDTTHKAGEVVLHDAADAAALRSAGYSWTTLVEDVQAASRAARRTTRRGPSSLPTERSDYRDLATYESELQALAAGNPGLVRRFTLSRTSAEGRPITALEIAGDVNAADGRPVYAVFGLHHAREWPSGEVVAEFAHDLVESYGDPRVRSLLDRVRVVLVPVVNPDGFVFSQDVDGTWRKNSPSRGVDLNRNYGAGWGGTGSSGNPLSSTYRGAGPFSEPESSAVHELSRTRQLTNVQSIHNISGDVLRQPGFDEYGTLTPDEPRMKQLGDAMGAATGYTSRTALSFGEIHGATEDWNYIAQGAFGYTIELGPAASSDFHGPYDTHVVAQYPGVREALLLAGEQAADATGHGVLTGTAPAGARLRLRRDFMTGTLCSGCGPFADFVDTTLDVPAGGRFEWHVGPSKRPWATGPEAWTLTCTDATGSERARREVAVGRGQRIDLGDACAPVPPAPAPAIAGQPPATAPGIVPPRATAATAPARLRVSRVRVRRATLARRRALVVALRVSGGALRDVRLTLRRSGRTVASRRIARVGAARRVRLALRRIPRAGRYRLAVRGVTAGGAVVSASATVEIRR